ncbi:MAG TPA: hypothetical protein VD770_02235, partial [Coxiellaceae bacterium]|nr:hypothetical protein [Coxiellaceae bacterium]
MLHWYKVAAYYLIVQKKGCFNNALIEALSGCVLHIDGDRLRDGALIILAKILVKYKPEEYIAESVIYSLQDNLKNEPCLSHLVAQCGELRQQFVLNNVTNKSFFSHTYSPLLEKSRSDLSLFKTAMEIDKNQSITGKSLEYNFKFSEFEVLRFVSHFAMLSFPIVKFNFEEGKEEDQQKYNELFNNELREAGFLASNGMLVKARVFKSAGCFDELNSDFEHKVTELVRKYCEKVSEEKINDLITTFIKGYKDIERKRARLGRFVPINALACFYSVVSQEAVLTMDSAALELKLAAANYVRDTLALAMEAKKIIDSKRSNENKQEAWLALAGNIITKIWDHPRTIVVQVGTPIKPPKDYSQHAFYVILKYHAATEQFQIIIINGGPGLKFH